MVPKKDNVNEDLLLEKAIKGDRSGLEYLVFAYQDLAYSIAIKIVLNNEDAEEVVQDSFMKAFASLSNFKKASKFSTWLYRIVYNTALTKISLNKPANLEINDHSGSPSYLTDDKKEWNKLFDADKKKYVNLALDMLKPEERVILTLHYIAEKSIAEISEVLDAKRSAVKMRLLRARKQLEIELYKLLGNEVKDL